MIADAPLSTEKVKFKLNEVKSKLEIEQKVKAGTEKLSQVMNNQDVDKKRQIEVNEKLAESNAKVALLNKALQRYQGLYVGDPDEIESSSNNTFKKNPVPFSFSLDFNLLLALPILLFYILIL